MSKIFKTSLVSLIIVLFMSVPVFAAGFPDNLHDIVYSNCRFYGLDFKTFNSSGGLVSNLDYSKTNLTFSDEVDGAFLLINSALDAPFGGSNSYYRTFIFNITLPTSSDVQDFSMIIILDTQNDSTNNLSTGVNTFFRNVQNGQYATVMHNNDGTISVSANNCPGGSTFQCQVSFVNTNSWRSASIGFYNIQVKSQGFQAVIDNDNRLYEKEKSETNSAGNSAASDVTGAIDDKSSGFLSSIENFTDAMSYTGTDAKLTIPSISFGLSGIIDEREWTPDIDVDFAYWVDEMPSSVMSLIRAITTIGLIVFCFKELYDLISYVLTLKKSGGGESE